MVELLGPILMHLLFMLGHLYLMPVPLLLWDQQFVLSSLSEPYHLYHLMT